MDGYEIHKKHERLRALEADWPAVMGDHPPKTKEERTAFLLWRWKALTGCSPAAWAARLEICRDLEQIDHNAEIERLKQDHARAIWSAGNP